MAEPGHFSLERLAEAAPLPLATLAAAALAFIAALVLSRETITEIPHLVEAKFGYDSQLQATLKNRSITADVLPVTFVDIDEAALDVWSDATRTTPRAKLSELIASLAAKKPSLIFVDFDLSGASLGEADGQLKELLANYPKDAPPLLVTRSLKPLECAHGKCEANVCTASHAVKTPASPFESVIAGKPNIQWVSSVFIPDGDAVVRSWRLWETECRNGAPSVLPSPQLVAAALVGPTAPGRAKLDAYLEALNGRVGAHDGDKISAGGVDWPKNANARDALIPFLISGSSPSKVSDWTGPAGFRYQRVAATSVLADEVADTALADRVIVLGASYGPDKLETPLGVMPGAVLLSNAIAVAPSVLDTATYNPIVRMLMTLVLAVLYGVIAKSLRAIPAAVAIAVASYVWLSLASFWLNPADAVDSVSLALVILGAFLALESVIEIIFDFFAGAGLSALTRKKTRWSLIVD